VIRGRPGHCKIANTRLVSYCSILVYLAIYPPSMNEARLSHLPFWGPSEGFFLIIQRPSGYNPNETFEFWVKGSG